MGGKEEGGRERGIKGRERGIKGREGYGHREEGTS